MLASSSLVLSSGVNTPSSSNSAPNKFKKLWEVFLDIISHWITTLCTAVIIVGFYIACFGPNHEMYDSTYVLILICYFIFLVFPCAFYGTLDWGAKRFEWVARFKRWFFELISDHTQIRFHIILFGSLMTYQTTFLVYKPEAVYRYRVQGIILSEKNPLVRGLPFGNEWTKKDKFASVKAYGTTSDGQELCASVSAEMSLSKNPAHWYWERGVDAGTSENEVRTDEALKAAFAKVISGMKLSEINRQSLVIDAETGLSLQLEQLGLRLNGTVTVHDIKPYFK